ncbi:hypothetical protein TESS_TESS_02822 [Tessaracoccus sp. O5.2]|uniref:hypothetical protein n=1 Tax=Tessaracoccus sp. O5.2 TaxID=3157622 RepID=UPI0035E4E09C
MGADLLSAGGILAAFLAGSVALFAPCCIVFLAPSYLAAAAKNRRWRLIPLTFVFAAGLGRVSQRSGSMGGIVDSCLVLLCSMTLRGPGSSR